MASLTHVCMWSEHDWIPITAEEASKTHSGGTVSASGGLFMCDLCNQYVTLTDEGKRVRHFRHSSRESDKNSKRFHHCTTLLSIHHLVTTLSRLSPVF